MMLAGLIAFLGLMSEGRGGGAGMQDKRIQKRVEVQAPAAEVWQAWSTQAGLETFFAPRARIELRPEGAFDIWFFPDAPKGERGAEDLRILSYLPGEMLSFEWDAPPSMPTVRREKSFVVVQLRALGTDRTEVTLTHLGWKEGEEWQRAFDYFTGAWDVVLGRLQRRFAEGKPIDWKAELGKGGK
jgi:uncharacterized protein YndB with AHSA1/START domain